MNIIVTEDYEEMSARASELVLKIVKQNPSAVLGLATGTTPIGLYRNMVRDYQENATDYSRIRTVNLDEYVSLPANHPQSYAYFMRKNLFDHIGIPKGNTFIEDGTATDPEAECLRYNALLEKMRQSVQVLGIGSNGHIAFNEPGTPFFSETHVVELTESTVKDNSRLFNDIAEVPRRAFTMGLKNIMNAEKIIILANGANKAQAVYGMVKGSVTENVPASILQRHADCTLICDRTAAKLL